MRSHWKSCNAGIQLSIGYWIGSIHCLLPLLLQFTNFVVSDFIAYHFNVSVQYYFCFLSYPSCFAAPLYQYLPPASTFAVCNCNCNNPIPLPAAGRLQECLHVLLAYLCALPWLLSCCTRLLCCRIFVLVLHVSGARSRRPSIARISPLCSYALPTLLCVVSDCLRALHSSQQQPISSFRAILATKLPTPTTDLRVDVTTYAKIWNFAINNDWWGINDLPLFVKVNSSQMKNA